MVTSCSCRDISISIRIQDSNLVLIPEMRDLFGNTDLEPQQTVKGEIGIQQQIGDDMSIKCNCIF